MYSGWESCFQLIQLIPADEQMRCLGMATSATDQQEVMWASAAAVECIPLLTWVATHAHAWALYI